MLISLLISSLDDFSIVGAHHFFFLVRRYGGSPVRDHSLMRVLKDHMATVIIPENRRAVLLHNKLAGACTDRKLCHLEYIESPSNSRHIDLSLKPFQVIHPHH